MQAVNFVHGSIHINPRIAGRYTLQRAAFCLHRQLIGSFWGASAVRMVVLGRVASVVSGQTCALKHLANAMTGHKCGWMLEHSGFTLQS